MSTVSAGLGIGGVALCFVGCCCGLLVIVGVPMGIAGAALGYLEREKVKRGEIDPSSETWAMVGMATGVIAFGFGVLYFIAMVIGAGSGMFDQLKKSMNMP
ncbi:MAG: hypothetical protein KC502_20405 [Myxococcales bacterium]|nr:hypothetical protein [Myxococcales bacterium]